ncbi:Uncharacterised protein [Staphylococcus aureus]|nr:Uncharacterised protein [Staphylococcus aureus]
MNAPITAITAKIGAEIEPKTPINNCIAPVTRLDVLTKLKICLITPNKLKPNTFVSTLLIATIGAIKAQNTPPKIPITPATCAIAGCVSNSLAINPARLVIKSNNLLAIGAIAVPNATNAFMMLPINCIIVGPFS